MVMMMRPIPLQYPLMRKSLHSKRKKKKEKLKKERKIRILKYGRKTVLRGKAV